MIRIYESTTASGTTAIYNDVAYVPVDEWFNLRVEFYTGTPETVRTKIYVNGELKVVSDNYYGKTASQSPAVYDGAYDKTTVYAMSGSGVSLYLDNVKVLTSSETYKPATSSDKSVIYNVDAEDDTAE